VSPNVIEWGGTSVATVKKGIAAAARRAGVKRSAHVLRHTAAVWMAEDGVPMPVIAQYLGTATAAPPSACMRGSRLTFSEAQQKHLSFDLRSDPWYIVPAHRNT
jgi:hypothetical protein